MKEKLKLLLLSSKVEHFLFGVLSIVLAGTALFVYNKVGVGLAAAYVTTLLAVVHQVKRKYRKQGEVSVLNALVVALPGWLVFLWTKVF